MPLLLPTCSLPLLVGSRAPPLLPVPLLLLADEDEGPVAALEPAVSPWRAQSDNSIINQCRSLVVPNERPADQVMASAATRLITVV